VTGVNSITATFEGNPSTFATSSNTTNLTVTVPAYTFSASRTSVSTAPGSAASVTLNLASLGYAGPVSFTTAITSSNGVAADVTASAAQVTLTSNGNGTSTLTITTNSSAANHTPTFPWKSSGVLMLGAVLFGTPSKLRRKQMIVGLFMLSLVLLLGTVACGGSGASSTTKPTPPSARTYTVLVTPSGTGSVTNPAAVSVVVTVQ